LAELGPLRVFGHKRDKDRTPCITDLVDEGDEVKLGGLSARVLFIPCHTSGHIAYYFEKAKTVFTGDTLFVAGCGRLFEGTAADMYRNMVKLTALPDETKVYCGHEYTESNLRFALTLEPANPKTRAKLEWTREMRAKGRPTVPSTIGDEKETNPFVRVQSPELQENLRRRFPDLPPDPVAVLERTRALKDSF
jgi:hydroxyacylglutathione hydrolase